MPEFWLVEVADDLAAQRTTRAGVWLSLKQVSGVTDVVDLRAITLDTLALFLMPDEEFRAGLLDARRRTTSPDHVIRAYWKGVRQPELPGLNGQEH
jgi:hypothetical protein